VNFIILNVGAQIKKKVKKMIYHQKIILMLQNISKQRELLKSYKLKVTFNFELKINSQLNKKYVNFMTFFGIV